MANSSSSSIISSFKFISYKVDDFKLKMEKKMSLLSFSEGIKDFKISLRIINPIYFKKNNSYIGGIDCKIIFLFDSKPIFNLEASISGLFQADSKLEKEIEENLVKHQIPTILFPYLRSTITTFIANSGFGSFVFPLINVVELSKKTIKKVQIKNNNDDVG